MCNQNWSTQKIHEIDLLVKSVAIFCLRVTKWVCFDQSISEGSR